MISHPSALCPSDHAEWRADKMGKSTLYESAHMLVGLNAFEPGQSHSLHAHAGMDKLYYVLEGAGEFLLEGQSLPMSVGMMLVAPEGVPHGIRNNGAARLLVMAVYSPLGLDAEAAMNHRIDSLLPYPFERLRRLLADVTPAAMSPIRLSIGEPQHPTPAIVREALIAHLNGLSTYPTTAGSEALRAAIAAWAARRFPGAATDPASQVLPVNGTREALFALAQAVIDPGTGTPLVACPNPFYQIYEGAALLAGAQPAFINQTAANRFGLDFADLSPSEWARTQLLYVCSPGNPTGRILTLDEWRAIFALSDEHGFVIASDECYADIYPDEARPPLGALQAAAALGRQDYRRLVVFVSLSKRSNAPGLRSGAVIGDAAVLARFLAYRTYHGCAMSLAVQHASIAAWNDEAHVLDNRALYRAKFDAVVPKLQPAMDVSAPEAGFYLWARVPGGDDEAYARRLFAEAHVTVLPGQYLGREAHGTNPGRGYIRMALVAPVEECIEAANRIAALSD